MKKGWVDFKMVKGAVTFEQVLAHYRISLKPAKGDELLGLCPFHEDTKPSFRVSTKKRVFHSFGCDAKGSAFDFIARKEAVTIKKAAQLAYEWFGIGQDGREAVNADMSRTVSPTEDVTASVEPNKPLKFTLKVESEMTPYARIGS